MDDSHIAQRNSSDAKPGTAFPTDDPSLPEDGLCCRTNKGGFMIDRPSYELSQEDRATFAKWVRGISIFYGAILLLLLALVAAQGFFGEPKSTDGVAEILAPDSVRAGASKLRVFGKSQSPKSFSDSKPE
jgi:hypothetical protein